MKKQQKHGRSLPCLHLMLCGLLAGCSWQRAAWHESLAQDTENIHALILADDGSIILRGEAHDYHLNADAAHQRNARQSLRRLLANGAAQQLIDLAPNPQSAPAQANTIRVVTDGKRTPHFILQRFHLYLPIQALPAQLPADALPRHTAHYGEALRQRAQRYGATLPPEGSATVMLILNGLQGEVLPVGQSAKGAEQRLSIPLHTRLHRESAPLQTHTTLVPLTLCCW